MAETKESADILERIDAGLAELRAALALFPNSELQGAIAAEIDLAEACKAEIMRLCALASAPVSDTKENKAFVMVPREPTHEMDVAGLVALVKCIEEHWAIPHSEEGRELTEAERKERWCYIASRIRDSVEVGIVYRAMLAAAPPVQMEIDNEPNRPKAGQHIPGNAGVSVASMPDLQAGGLSERGGELRPHGTGASPSGASGPRDPGTGQAAIAPPVQMEAVGYILDSELDKLRRGMTTTAAISPRPYVKDDVPIFASPVPPPVQQEAVAWRFKYRDCLGWLYRDERDWIPNEPYNVHDVQPLYASPVPSPAAPADRDEWRPIETAPKDRHIVGYTAAGSVVRMRWTFIGDDAVGWGAVTEGEHPSCWTDGFCWSSNSEEEPSDPPVKWMELPSRAMKSAPEET